MALPSAGTAFPLYELFMDKTPETLFDCSAGTKGKGGAALQLMP
jgi:hypothetical protein